MKKEIQITEKLKKFLIKEKVLTKFKDYCKTYPKDNSITDSIDTAFIWDETKEGQNFWYTLDIKFKKENEL